MNEGKKAFVHNLTKASREVLDRRIKKALDSSGFEVDLKKLMEERMAIQRACISEICKYNHGGPVSEQDRIAWEDHLQSIDDKIDEEKKKIDALKATQMEEQVKEVDTESGGDTTEKVSGKAWIWCPLF